MPSPRQSELTPGYRFNPRAGTTGRYIDKRGRFVSQKVITTELERVTVGAKDEMIGLSKRLQAGEISLADWQLGMRDRIKAIHNAQAAIAKGGWAQMSQADWGAVGQMTKRQYAFLQKFAVDIEQGKQVLNGNFLRRAGMYADAGRGTGQDMRRREAANNGYTEEQRVLNPADHCSDCVEYAGLGWQPIGTLPRIGDSVCRTNCRCEFEYR